MCPMEIALKIPRGRVLQKITNLIPTFPSGSFLRIVQFRSMGSHKNIVIFGDAGSGKSSIINMVVGREVAKVSSGMTVQGTVQPERYEASFDGVSFNIYDTMGLNFEDYGSREGDLFNDRMQSPHWKAIIQLYTLIRGLNSVNLLIYCMRGRIKESARANWLFSKILCADEVPVIAVETGLEKEEDLEGRRILIGQALEKYGIAPRGIACVVAVRGKRGEHENRYELSQHRLRRLIMQSYRIKPWGMTTDDWIGHIYQTTYDMRLCLFSNARREFSKEVIDMVDKFVEETGMKKDESEELKLTLLNAEKKSRRFSFH